MATTISFSSGSFSTGTNDLPGSNDVVVTDSQGGAFTLATENNESIVNLGIQGDNQTQFLNFTSDTIVTVRGLTANMGGGNDVLIIGGKAKGGSLIRLQDGNDTFVSQDVVRDSSIRFNAGNDNAILSSPTEYVAVDSSFEMGQGDDSLVFGGSVRNAEVSLGLGADSVEYLGNILGSNLNLGGEGSMPDGQADTIMIAGDSSITGLVITGADENDTLFIGSSEYTYNTSDNRWVNANDPNDIRNFS